MELLSDFFIKNSPHSTQLPPGAKRSSMIWGLIIEARAPIEHLYPRPMSSIRRTYTYINTSVLQMTPGKFPIFSWGWGSVNVLVLGQLVGAEDNRPSNATRKLPARRIKEKKIVVLWGYSAPHLNFNFCSTRAPSAIARRLRASSK